MKIFFYFSMFIFVFVSCQSNTKKSKLSSSPFKTHPLSIVQGSTDKDETYISVVSQKSLTPLEFSFTEASDPDEKSRVQKKLKVFKSFLSPDKKHVIEHLHVENMKINTDYKLVVKNEGVVVDERIFQAFDAEKKRPRIGVVSCMDDRFTADSERMWASYLNKFVDINFFIGDNVYADFNGLIYTKAPKKQLWRRYLETFSKLYVYHSSSLKPTLVMWDDHDYGADDGGAEYAHKEDSLNVFNAFYPRYKVDGFNKTNFGVGSHFVAYGQNFLFLDSRYFRTVNDENGDHLGKDQLSYVENLVRKSKRPTWLIKGDQFFGAYHPFESYERLHPKEFSRLVSSLNKAKKPVMFVSGDRHLSEIMKLSAPEFDFKSFEVTSSGIHAKVFKDAVKNHPNPRQIVGKSGVYNYTVIEIVEAKKYKVTSFGEKNWSHFTRELKL